MFNLIYCFSQLKLDIHNNNNKTFQKDDFQAILPLAFVLKEEKAADF